MRGKLPNWFVDDAKGDLLSFLQMNTVSSADRDQEARKMAAEAVCSILEDLSGLWKFWIGSAVGSSHLSVMTT
jgi:hypothetical protein